MANGHNDDDDDDNNNNNNDMNYDHWWLLGEDGDSVGTDVDECTFIRHDCTESSIICPMSVCLPSAHTYRHI